jgi:hypothetical protein
MRVWQGVEIRQNCSCPRRMPPLFIWDSQVYEALW